MRAYRPPRQRLRFLPPELFCPVRFRGTFASFFRASDKPIAIACLRLFTVFPLLPDLSVPFFRRRIALSTRFDAALPYFRRPEDFRAAIVLLRFGFTRLDFLLDGACCASESTRRSSCDRPSQWHSHEQSYRYGSGSHLSSNRWPAPPRDSGHSPSLP